MTIKTIPAFYYVDAISTSNYLMNFKEPNQSALELTAQFNAGSRSINDLLIEIVRGLNASGENSYSFSFDRNTRLVTLNADDDFDLLVQTGSNAGLSVFSLIGFTGADRTGSNSYVGDSPIGAEYIPQTIPQEFTAFENNKEGVLSSINESAAGVVEVVTFGFRSFMEMNIKWITNETKSKGNFIENNPNALQEARDFLTFCIQKSDIEFMIDKDNRANYKKILLESTRGDRKGNSFQLREMLNQSLDEHYETGKLKFREVN